MKILQLIHTQQLRGAETFATQLSNHLNESGHEVLIVSVYAGDGDLPTELPIENLGAGHAFDRQAMKKLATLIKANDIEIVQANAGDTLKFAVITKLFFRCKSKIIFRNASTISRYLRSLSQKMFYRFLLRQTDHIVSVSESSKADMLKLYPHVASKISVVPVGVEEIELTHSRERNVLLHVGGFSFEKNHRGLLSVFSQLLKVNPDLKLWLVGDGPLKNEMVQYAEQLSISDRVVFWGARRDVAAFMQRASVFVLSSILEGLPAVIMEAMSAALPVVSYNVGGIAEVVKHNQTGWLIPVNNETAFAAAVNEALFDLRKTDEIVKQATLLVNNEYKNDVIAASFEKIYERLLASEQYNTQKLQVIG